MNNVQKHTNLIHYLKKSFNKLNITVIFFWDKYLDKFMLGGNLDNRNTYKRKGLQKHQHETNKYPVKHFCESLLLYIVIIFSNGYIHIYLTKIIPCKLQSI
jgi:hypothetical protein